MIAITVRKHPRSPNFRGLASLLAGVLLAGSANSSEPEVAPQNPSTVSIFIEEVAVAGPILGSPSDPAAEPLFLLTFDDDYFWLDTSDSIKRETGVSLFDPASFHLQAPALADDQYLEHYKFRKFKLIRYDRQLNIANRDVLLKVRTPGKRRSIMSLELKF